MIEFSDRYSATGTPRPKMLTCCHNCEGMGIYPREVEHPKSDDFDDRCEFVKCEECNGTRKCSWIKSVLRIPKTVSSSLGFFFRTAFNKDMHPKEWSAWKRIKVCARISAGL